MENNTHMPIELDNLLSKAEANVADAKRKVSLARLSIELYPVIYQMSLNEAFSLQAATYFEFDRIFKSKEFTQSEKDSLLPYINKYNYIISK